MYLIVFFLTLIAFQLQNLIGHNTHAKVLLILYFKLLRYLIIFYYNYFSQHRTCNNCYDFHKTTIDCQLIDFFNFSKFETPSNDKIRFYIYKKVYCYISSKNKNPNNDLFCFIFVPIISFILQFYNKIPIIKNISTKKT